MARQEYIEINEYLPDELMASEPEEDTAGDEEERARASDMPSRADLRNAALGSAACDRRTPASQPLRVQGDSTRLIA